MENSRLVYNMTLLFNKLSIRFNEDDRTMIL